MTNAVRVPALASAVPALGWALAGAVGWGLFHLLGGPSRSGTARELVWAACLCVAVAGAVVVATTVAGRYLAPGAARWASAVGLGWAVANAAGWFLAVEVGGPATGMVTGVAVGAAAAGVRLRTAVALGLAGVLGMVVARVLVPDLPPVVGLVVSVAAGLAVVAVLRGRVARELPLCPVVLMTAAFGAAWVGAWIVADAVLSPLSASASIAAELVAAVALCAAVYGYELRSRTGEPVRAVVLRWSVATVLALVVGAALATVLTLVTHGTTPIDHLDVGTTVTLAIAAWWAARPTLERLLAARTGVVAP